LFIFFLPTDTTNREEREREREREKKERKRDRLMVLQQRIGDREGGK
jgi:guanylate kinase